MALQGIEKQLAMMAFENAVKLGKDLNTAERDLHAIMAVEDARAIRVDFEIEANLIRRLDDDAIVNERALAWYRPGSDGRFFSEVRKQLSKSLDAQVVESVAARASQVLGACENPRKEKFASRGLVVGYVQSGKTTSFISLAAKAADAGYKLIIILSGITDNLRTQTQERVDSTLVGDLMADWRSWTSADSDFIATGKPDPDLNPKNAQPVVAVVKKNPARLQALVDWLKTSGKSLLAQTPILVIDDEADQASPNTAKDADRASRINGLLKELVSFQRTAYVAYTATPFANMLIDATAEADLYPRDFIISLPEPEGYVGASLMFGRDKLDSDDDSVEPLPIVREVAEEESQALLNEARGGDEAALPEGSALETAVEWFLLATSARRHRAGKASHSSMLVNISALSDSHFRTRDRIAAVLESIRQNREGRDSGLRNRLQGLWERETAAFPAATAGESPIDFEAVWAGFPAVLEATRVVVDNYKSEQRLSYSGDSPETVIVVGGNTMSRGLTLEGLTSSFFLRQSKTYDTLLQMGRWFGFRPGYLDLIRVWMPSGLQEWFRDLALIEAEIREEIRKYAPMVVDGEIFGGEVQPNQIGVRIRMHPAMAVVAPAKARNAKAVSLSYARTVQQTIIFESDVEEVMRHNLDVVRSTLSALGRSAPEVTFPSGRRGFRHVPSDAVLEFLAQYAVHPQSRSFLPDLMSAYIRKENDAGGLLQWNVVIAGSHLRSDETAIDLGLTEPVMRVNRSRRGAVDGGARIGALVTGGDRILDLEPAELYDDAVRLTSAGKADRSAYSFKEKHGIDDGLMVIYPIDKASNKHENGTHDPEADLAAAEDVIGVGLYFPDGRGVRSAVEYIGANLPEPIVNETDEEVEEVLAADEADAAQLAREAAVAVAGADS